MHPIQWGLLNNTYLRCSKHIKDIFYACCITITTKSICNNHKLYAYWCLCDLKQCKNVSMDDHGWEFETLIMDGWKKMTKYGVVIHYQEVWMSKVWCLVFFFTFKCYLFVCRLVCLFFNGSVLVLVVEQVFYCIRGLSLWGLVGTRCIMHPSSSDLAIYMKKVS